MLSESPDRMESNEAFEIGNDVDINVYRLEGSHSGVLSDESVIQPVSPMIQKGTINNLKSDNLSGPQSEQTFVG